MSVFDRFTNPVWHDISRLDSRRQRIAAFLITGYGSCRHNINENLVAPLDQNITVQLPNGISPETRDRLIDEALVGLLKSCKVPQSDPAGNLPDQFVQNVTEVWGMFALADCNHRLRRTQPETLKGSPYSSDPDEARTQVLVKWAEILGLTQSDFVMNANRHWFLEQWSGMTAAMIAGFLKGFGRTPDEIVLKKARSEAASIPEHRLAKARYMVERLATAPLSSPQGRSESADRDSSVPARVSAPPPAAHKQPQQELHGVEWRPDGKAIINLSPEAGPLDFIRSMLVVMRPSLLPQHLKAAEHWVSGIAKEPIHGGRWSPKHDDILVRGFERFLWEGDANIEADSDLTKIRDLVRKTYPNIAGSRIDVPLTDDMRRMFRAWFAKKPGGSQSVRVPDHAGESGLNRKQAQQPKAAANAQSPDRGRMVEIPTEMMDRGRYYRHNHFRGITDWEQRMVNEFGQRVIPLLGTIWNRTS